MVPLKPRSEAKRNALHTAVHNPPKSKSLATIVSDLDDWEKLLEEYELCGGTVTEADKRTILLKKLPTTVFSSLVSSLRKCADYDAMKADLEAEIVFLKDFGPTGSGQAHLIGEPTGPTDDDYDDDDDDDDEDDDDDDDTDDGIDVDDDDDSLPPQDVKIIFELINID